MVTEHDEIRRYRVHARHVDGHHARIVHEDSFEAAAVAYLEDFHLAVPLDDDREISVIVQDVSTGHQHCFKVDLETGDAVPCG